MANQKLVAEFIGIMLGDGSIGVYNTKAGDKQKIHRRVKVTLDSRNKVYTDHVENVMKRVLEVEPRVRYKKSENAVDVSTHKIRALSFVLNELNLKMSPKWGRMEIPAPYDRKKFGHFVLKGLFDTDGCLSIFSNNGIRYPRIEIRLCPSPAQEQVSKLLDDYGFKYRIQHLERGKTRVRISGKTQLKKWFDVIGSSNPIHVEKAKMFITL